MTGIGKSLKHRGHSDEGFALIVVIAFLLIFSSFLGAFAMSAHIKALTGATRLSDFRLQTTAQAITAMVADKIATAQAARKSGPAGFARCHLGDFDVDLEVQPHSGLISLNLASEETLATGFDALDIPLEDAKMLAKAVVDFRYPGGASNEALLPPLPNGYKHAPFEDVMELTDFKALQGVPAWKLARVFSVYGAAATPSPATLSPLLQSTMGSGIQALNGQRNAATIETAVTVDATVHQGGRLYYVGDVFEIGGIAGFHRVSSVSWDHMSTPLSDTSNPGLCAAAFGAKDVQMLREAL